MRLTTNASCAEVSPATANIFRRNTFGFSLNGGRPATMASTVSASPAPRTNRCVGPLPPRLRLARSISRVVVAALKSDMYKAWFSECTVQVWMYP
jgi:hypothetical protein